jgi:hypothetical protein
MSQQDHPELDIVSPRTATKIARIQSWQRGAQLTASEPHSPATTASTSRRHSMPPATPSSAGFDVRVMPAPAVPQVQVHLVEPRPVLHHKRSHVASLHSWENHDLESQAGLRPSDRDERSTLSGDMGWRERATRASRALFGYNAPLTPWKALNVDKNRQPTPHQQQQKELDVKAHMRADSEMGSHKCHCDCSKRHNPKRKRVRMCLCLLLILLILFAVTDVIFLNIRVLNPDFGIVQPTSTATPTNLVRDGTSTFVAPTASASPKTTAEPAIASSTLTSVMATPSLRPSPLQNCLTQFQLNAPSSPESYPCDTCFSVLSGAPSDAGAGPAVQ